MSNDRYERIRAALAMGPTPGPREPVTDRQYSDLPYLVLGAGASDAKSVEWMPLYVHVGGRSGWVEQKANTLLIAACDPDTIRALLAERDALAATLAATEAARDGYRDDARQMHAALVQMVAQYESEFDHEDTHKFRPKWLREALARTNALQEEGEGWEIEPETLDAAKVASYERAERDINEALNMGNGSYLP